MTDPNLDLEARLSVAMSMWTAAMEALLAEADRIAHGSPIDCARMEALNNEVNAAKRSYEQAKADRDRVG